MFHHLTEVAFIFSFYHVLVKLWTKISNSAQERKLCCLCLNYSLSKVKHANLSFFPMQHYQSNCTFRLCFSLFLPIEHLFLLNRQCWTTFLATVSSFTVNTFIPLLLLLFRKKWLIYALHTLYIFTFFKLLWNNNGPVHC